MNEHCINSSFHLLRLEANSSGATVYLVLCKLIITYCFHINLFFSYVLKASGRTVLVMLLSYKFYESLIRIQLT